MPSTHHQPTLWRGNLAPKVDAEMIERIVTLKMRDRVTNQVIAERLGISLRTIRVYLARLRSEGRMGDPVRNGIYQDV